MAARALGALLAFAAASLFAVSLASPTVWTQGPGWWDGHPTVDGKVIERKDAHIGLYGAVGCDSRGCQPIEVDATFSSVAIVELGATLLAAGLAAVLALAAFRSSDRKKTIAGLSIGSTIVVAVGAAGLLIVGLDVKSTQQVTVPIGLGMYMFWGGVVANTVAGLLVLSERPEPLRLKPHLPAPPDAVHPPPVDVREILRDQLTTLAPPSLGPEPMHGRLPPTPQSAAMFEGAPQLRPLYEVAGNAPIAPQVALPTRAPTPMPRAAAEELAGLSPSAEAPARTSIGTGPPRGKPQSMPPAATEASTDAAPRPIGGTDPALARPKIPTTPPVSETARAAPLPFAQTELAVRATARRDIEDVERTERDPVNKSKPAVATPASQRAAAALPKPTPPASKPRVPLPTKPPPIGKSTPTSGEKPIMPRVPVFGGPKPIATPPKPEGEPSTDTPLRAYRPSQPTLAHTVPPMPTLDNLPAPAVLPARSSNVRIETDADDSLEKGMRETEAITAVEIDAEAKAKAKAERSAEQFRTELETEQALEGRDASVGQASMGSSPIVELDTAEQRMLAADSASRPQSEPADLAEAGTVRATTETPVAAPPPELPPTRQVEITKLPELLPTRQVVEAVRASAPELPPTRLVVEAVRAEPPVRPSQVPLSTAPTTLPPPKQTAAVPSGPTPACPQCEAPMAWVEEHLRFYCKQCRMYF